MRRAALAAEFLGTAVLLMVIVGSGIAVETLGAGAATQLFIHAIAVGTGLGTLIAVLGPVSGAHFNPAVTAAFALRRAITTRHAGAYVAAQVAGALAGTAIAHVWFDRALFSVSSQIRSGPGLLLSELIATTVLAATILLLVAFGRTSFVPAAVGGWVMVAIVATPSTGFANPAVTLARAFTDSFTGIAPASLPAFAAAQMLGAVAAAGLAAWITRQDERISHGHD